MEELKDKCLFILDFFESKKMDIAFIEVYRKLVLKTFKEEDKVGLKFLLRDFKDMMVGYPKEFRKQFTIKALDEKLKFDFKIKDKLEIIGHIIAKGSISDDFEYAILEEFEFDLRESKKLSPELKKDLKKILKEYKSN